MFTHRLWSVVNKQPIHPQTAVWVWEILKSHTIEKVRVSTYYNAKSIMTKIRARIDYLTFFSSNFDLRVNLKLYLTIFADTN